MSMQRWSLLFPVMLAAVVATPAFGQAVLPSFESPSIANSLPIPVASNPAQDQQAMPYSVVYSDANDVTHFKDERLSWQARQGNGTHQNFVTPYAQRYSTVTFCPST
jgi:hypothetical protein